jgi:dihydropyrimidinase/allantoinase
MDLGAKTKVDKSKSYSKARETARVYDGWELACRLEYTIVRGRVIVDKGIADESSRGWGKVVAPVRRVK